MEKSTLPFAAIQKKLPVCVKVQVEQRFVDR